MSDLITGPAAGGARGGKDGPMHRSTPPPLLWGALGAAALISIVVVALFGGMGLGGDGGQAVSARDGGSAQAASGEPPQRVKLVIALRGSGDGEIQIVPSDSVCDTSCVRRYDTGTRVTVTATPASGSTFEGWGDACDGNGSCSILLDEQRALSATFDREPSDPGAPPPPPEPTDEELDPGADDLDANLDPVAAGDCADNRDNDGDGLTDIEQDPDCVAGSTEAGGVAAPPPPPARASNDCSDGRDNDGDGLTDTAQDPDCVAGTTESGKEKSTKRAPSECRDGKDNDGDGLIDSAQDPGCIEDGSES